MIKERKMEDKIKEALEQIRPFLQRDGGDLEFVEYTDDKIVKSKTAGTLRRMSGSSDDDQRRCRTDLKGKLS